MSSDMSPEGMKKLARATEDEDVEGHGARMARKATEEPEGESLRKTARVEGDEDVEGHGIPRAVEPEGIASPRTRIAEDEDVEGHGMPMRSPSSRGE